MSNWISVVCVSYLGSVCCVIRHFGLRLLLFFFKQKTAYELRISDWSSDVCSSDLAVHLSADDEMCCPRRSHDHSLAPIEAPATMRTCRTHGVALQIGRASCRERVCQYV